MTLSGTFANRRNLRLSWNTSANPPSIGQLQNVVNNSNPLSLTTGNPGLRPTYSHTISLRVSEANPMQSKSKFLFANVTRTSHPIANSTFTAPSDTTLLEPIRVAIDNGQQTLQRDRICFGAIKQSFGRAFDQR